MESVWEHPEVVSSYLNKKYDKGWVEGPDDPADSPAVRVSRFGVMPSKQPGSWHLTLDLSSPEGFSINGKIDLDMCPLSYGSVNDAAMAPGLLWLRGYKECLLDCSNAP